MLKLLQSKERLDAYMDSDRSLYNDTDFPKKNLSEQAEQKFIEARVLFSIGMEVDPYHGPLYHAYGNMELVTFHIYYHSFPYSLRILDKYYRERETQQGLEQYC